MQNAVGATRVCVAPSRGPSPRPGQAPTPGKGAGGLEHMTSTLSSGGVLATSGLRGSAVGTLLGSPLESGYELSAAWGHVRLRIGASGTRGVLSGRAVCLSTDGYLLRTFVKWAATAAQGPRGALQRVGPRGPGRPAELGEPATRRPGSVRGPRRSPDSVPPASRGPRAGRGGASVPWGLCGPRHPLPAAAHRSLREGK